MKQEHLDAVVIIKPDMSMDLHIPAGMEDDILDDNAVLACAITLRIREDKQFVEDCLDWFDAKARASGLYPVVGGNA